MKEKEKLIKNNLKDLINYFSKQDVISNIEKNYQKENIRYLNFDEIIDNHFIEEARIDENTIEEIEKSILANGIYNPLIVRPAKKNKFEVIIGRKRWIASTKLQKREIPVLIKNYDDEETLLISLCDARENKNFNPIELAYIIYYLSKNFKYKKQDIALILHQSPAQISNYLSLLSLPKDIIFDISTGKLSYGHAKALSRLKEKEIRNILKKVYAFNLSVRDTEKLAKGSSTNLKSNKKFAIKTKGNTIVIRVNNSSNFNKVYKKIMSSLK